MTDRGPASPSPPAFGRARPSPLERGLRLFSDVRPGEGRTVVLMFASVLLILCAYYLVKPLREGWLAVTGVEGLTKMEVKAYSSFGQAVLLLAVLALYGHLVSRWPRDVLVRRATWFCMANILVFWALQPDLFVGTVPYLGIVFYLWVGMFGVFVVAQFFAFAADLYVEERGNRLMPVIAIGATGGGVVGSALAERLARWSAVGTDQLLLAALVPLAISIALMRAARASAPPKAAAAGAPAEGGGKPDPRGALRLVLGSGLLLAVAVIALLTNWVNTNGENLLFRVVQEVLEARLADRDVADAAAARAFIRTGTTAFYGDFFFWVNLVALVLQAFVASRLLKHGGFAAIFLLLPVIALVSYTAMALVPILAVIKTMKIAENATDYSIANTARHVLWLPMPAEVTFKGKPTVDCLFVRVGDGLAALTVLAGVQLLGLAVAGYFALNVALVVAWLGLAAWVAVVRKRTLEGDGVVAPPV